jgi:hypothetical protein
MAVEVHTRVRGLWRLMLLCWLCRLGSARLIAALLRTGWFDPRIGIKVGRYKREWERARLEIEYCPDCAEARG